MKKYMKIIVNSITTIRFLCALMTPILKFFVSDKAFIISIIILFMSDSIDGFLARKFKVQSLYGSFMDTIADKALIGMLTIMLLINHIDILLFMLIGEIVISLINIIRSYKRKEGKLKPLGKNKNVAYFYYSYIMLY
ncbi:MAG: CDP-alcohol phosphatidyltransferase family protein [Clostridia bacterium]|nr:CDP-alcohol phosphatidyltransferase family protein [Clostridia bacterium]